MDITFMVGNGFDLAVGLNTSYYDFKKRYLKQPSPSKIIQKMKEDMANDERNWADLETGLGKFPEKIPSITANEFLECLEDVRENMNKFIEDEETTYFKDKNISFGEIDAFKKGVAGFFQDLNEKGQRHFKKIMEQDQENNSQIHFISFNYTNVFDQYVKKLASRSVVINSWRNNNMAKVMKINPNVLHIHSTIGNYPIFGVESEDDVKEKSLLKNEDVRRAFIKQESDDLLGDLSYEKADEIIESSRIICLFGLSIGNSDSRWWGKIMQWLDKAQDRQLIVFMYSEKLKKKDNITDLNNYIGEIKHKIMQNCKRPAGNENIENRIFISVNPREIFGISKITQEAVGTNSNAK